MQVLMKKRQRKFLKISFLNSCVLIIRDISFLIRGATFKVIIW
jgi:hypothetical protein